KYFTYSVDFRVGQLCDAMATLKDKDARKTLAKNINSVLGQKLVTQDNLNDPKTVSTLLSHILTKYPATQESPDPLDSFLKALREKGQNPIHTNHRNHFFELANRPGTELQKAIIEQCITKAVTVVGNLVIRENVPLNHGGRDIKVCTLLDAPASIVT